MEIEGKQGTKKKRKKKRKTFTKRRPMMKEGQHFGHEMHSGDHTKKAELHRGVKSTEREREREREGRESVFIS